MIEKPTNAGIVAQRERLMAALQTYGSHHAEFSRRFAVWLGLHSTDGAALLEIVSAEEEGAPLSPARLSERILLSSGATTALINRLEGAGHVIRTREHTDRRIVTLHSSAHIQERADEFFDRFGKQLDAMMSAYPPELLAQFEDFLADLNASMRAHLIQQTPDECPEN